MKNVVETGHVHEMHTVVKNFRPEIFVFHGYFFQRRSASVVAVWKAHTCDNCKQDMTYEEHFVRVGSLTDEDLQRHGLKLSKEGKLPLRGTYAYHGAPFICEVCLAKWLKGDALEVIK